MFNNTGIARLIAENRNGSSVVTTQYSQAPLQIHRPLNLFAGEPPVVYIKTPSSGLLNGDVHQFDFELRADARLEIRTQAATQVYPGRSNQDIKIKVGPGARLVFKPHPLIIGAGANLDQQVQIDLAENASIDYEDQWCAGRIEMNECWQFERYSYFLHVSRNGRLLLREKWTVVPGETPLTSLPICDRFTHFSNRLLTGRFLDSYAGSDQFSDRDNPGEHKVLVANSVGQAGSANDHPERVSVEMRPGNSAMTRERIVENSGQERYWVMKKENAQLIRAARTF